MRKMLVLAFVLSLFVGVFGVSAQESALEPLEEPIIWYLRASVADVEGGLPQVNEALNALLAERGFNATVKLVYLDRSEFNDRMTLINSAFEPYDLALTTYSWVNLYPNNVANDYFIPLTAYEDPNTGEVINMLEKYAPNLYASMPKEAWDAARINGEIYAVINQQFWPKPLGVSIRADVLEALGLQEAFNSITSYADLTPIMATIKAAIDDGSIADKIADGKNVTHVFATIDLFQPINFGYDQLGTPLAVIDVNDPELKVTNFYETPAFLEAAKLRREWQVAGYTTPDPVDFETANAGYKAGQFVMDVSRLIKPGGNLEQAARYGYSWTERAIAPVILTTDGPVSTMTGISSVNEDDPVRVARLLMFLDMVHTDPEIYNLIARGIEGVHWNWVDKERKLIAIAENSNYRPNVDWAIGNQFNAYYINEAQIGAWEESAALNVSAQPSPALGFVLDRSPVELQFVAIEGGIAEYFDPIKDGQVEDVEAAVAALNKFLYDNGLQDILDEAQKQIDAWRASK